MNILKPEQQLSDASANFSISNNKKKLVGLGALFILIMMIAVSIFFYFRGATLSRSEPTNNNDYAQKEQENTNDVSQNNKTSKFFENNGKMYLQDTNNLSLRNPLLFEKADPLTFRYITKFTGFDDKFAKLSPGKVMVGYSIRYAIENGFQVYDFLRESERYKSSF